MKISAVLVVKNEENNIDECLSSLKGFVDEIIVIDDGSSDRTKDIATKYTGKIIAANSKESFDELRNIGIEKAQGEWILVIDADERLSKSLADELRGIARENKADVVFIPRKNIIFNKWIEHTGLWPDYTPRFFRKGKVRWQVGVHKEPLIEGRSTYLEAKEELAITHYNYSSTSQYLNKLDRYTDIEAKFRKVNLEDVYSSPNDDFINRFFSREGYKDNLHGFVLSSLQAFYTLILYVKLWENKGFKEEDFRIDEVIQGLRRNSSEIEFWILNYQKSKTGNNLKKIYYSLKQRLLLRKLHE